MTSSFPQRFGPHILIHPINAGGMGEVFLALARTATGPERLCVIKRMLEELLNDPTSVKRFMREADIARRLAHENIVRTLDAGAVEGEPFLAQEFIEGHDLGAILQRCSAEERHMPIGALAHIGHELAGALSYLHAFEGMGLVHRDVSPANVRVTYDGGVKLLDLGLAKGAETAHVTRTGFVPGKLAYQAPEQLLDREPDGRADVYAAAVLLWELAAGRPAGTAIEAGQAVLPDGNREKMIHCILQVMPPPPSAFNPGIPPAFDALVMKALAKEPAQRFSSAKEFQAAFAAVAGKAASGRADLAALMGFLFAPAREREQREEVIAAARRLPAETPRPEVGPAVRSRLVVPLLATAMLVGAGLMAWSLGRGTPLPNEPVANSPVTPPAPTPAAVAPVVRTSPTPAPPAPRAARVSSRPVQTVAPPPAPAFNPLDLARRAFDANDFPGAIEHARAALAGGQQEQEARELLAAAYVKTARYHDAEREYAEALRLDPGNALLKRRLELVHHKASGAP